MPRVGWIHLQANHGYQDLGHPSMSDPRQSVNQRLRLSDHADLATQHACFRVFPWKLSHVPVLFADVNR